MVLSCLVLSKSALSAAAARGGGSWVRSGVGSAPDARRIPPQFGHRARDRPRNPPRIGPGSAPRSAPRRSNMIRNWPHQVRVDFTSGGPSSGAAVFGGRSKGVGTLGPSSKFDPAASHKWWRWWRRCSSESERLRGRFRPDLVRAPFRTSGALSEPLPDQQARNPLSPKVVARWGLPALSWAKVGPAGLARRDGTRCGAPMDPNMNNGRSER